ncbi:hypothetical protein AeMF1_017460 [Aphanomyces euteiches]|nr:hypothetical protein AeMF1_017460 [Aphanomyces euteiches]
MGSVSSHAKKPFDYEEFKVAWLAFKGEMSEVGARGRSEAKKSGLLSSKLLRSLYGDAVIEDLSRHTAESVSREHFIIVLALYYLGNAEDKINYVFSMYASIYGMDRNDDGAISSVDLECLFEYLSLYHPVPEELINVFDGCQLAKEAPLTCTTFLKWVRETPELLEYIAEQLPPQLSDSTKHSLTISTDEPFIGDVLNQSPSMKHQLRHNQSFDIVGGDSSEDSDASSDDLEKESSSEQAPRSSPPPSPPLDRAPRSSPPPASPPKDPNIPPPPLSFDENYEPKKVKNNTAIGKFGRAVGGGIRTMLHPQKSKTKSLATAIATGENHHFIGGYLHKVSDGKWAKRNWHLRWFVLDLERGILSYYKSNPSSIVHSPHGSVAFYEGFDIEPKKPHPWYRGAMDLNQPNVSLLFDKQFGHHAPNKFIFQVSNASIGESDSKRGFQYKLCANSEEEFMQWTSAISEVINRKHVVVAAASTEAPKETLQQQLHRQKIEQAAAKKEEEVTPEETPPSTPPQSSSTPLIQPHPSPPSPALPPPPEIKWHVQLSIHGRENCLMLIGLVNVWCYVTFYWLGFLVQIPIMGLATYYLLQFAQQKRPPKSSTKGSTMAKSATHFKDDDMLPCLKHGTCCLHAIQQEDTDETDETTSTDATDPIMMVPGPPKAFHFDMLSSFKQSQDDDTDDNAWSTAAAASTFNVRSKEYKKTKKKEPSQPALFDFLGIDVIRTDAKIDCIAEHINLSDEHDRLFILHAQMPLYAPSLFNSSYDGPGASLVMYWSIPNDVQEQLEETENVLPAIGLLKRFFDSAKEPLVLERFKVIAQVVNEKDCGLSGYTKKLLQKNNATPVLTRPQHRIYHRERYTEVDVDVHIFSLVARTGINALIDKTSNMIIDVSFVLQGETDTELPEHILGVCRLVRVDLSKAKHLNDVACS